MGREMQWRAAAWRTCPVNGGDVRAGKKRPDAEWGERRRSECERPGDGRPARSGASFGASHGRTRIRTVRIREPASDCAVLPKSPRRESSRQRHRNRAATVPSGLVIAPLPTDTLAALLLILLVFVLLVLIVADRPRGDRPRGLRDPSEVIPARDSEKNGGS